MSAWGNYMSRKGGRLSSTIVTMLVIAILIVAGPAQAVSIEFGTPSDATPDVGDTVTFDVTVTANTDENIPVENVTLDVNGTSCDFPVNGGASLTTDDACAGFTLTRNPSADNAFQEDDRYGYGYGYGYGFQNTTFGYGYGYGYGSGPDAGKALSYTVTWDTTDYDTGTYEFRFHALASDGDSSFTYSTEDSLFITLSAPATTTQSEATGNNGGGGGGDCVDGYSRNAEGGCTKDQTPPELSTTSAGGDLEGSTSGDSGNGTQPTTVDTEEDTQGNLLTGEVTGEGGGLPSWSWLLILGLIAAGLLAAWLYRRR